jgi:hypothetical protein
MFLEVKDQKVHRLSAWERTAARLCLGELLPPQPKSNGRRSLPGSAFPGRAWERESGEHTT